LYNRTPINNYIRAREVRVIDEAGKQLGVLPIEKALSLAREKNLDLIQVTGKVEPPVCKIADYGKYLYRQHKKEKTAKPKGGELKGIRLTFGISEHDMQIRAKQTEKFLKDGDVLKVEMRLRGREKALQNFAREKFAKFVELVNKLVFVKVERPMKKEFGGLTMIISKKESK